MIGSGGVETDVALKMLHGALKAHGGSVRRLRDEGRMLGALNHPTILNIHDLVVLNGRVALVTEYVPGQDLSLCLGDMPLSVTLEVLAQVADALSAAWTATSPDGQPLSLIHRDIKPSNIRVGVHGQVKLLDFGIAKASNVDRESETARNSVVGSFMYMAPERFDNRGDTPSSDVFSLGCILYEALAGERLYANKSAKNLYLLAMSDENHRAHVDEHVAALPDVGPEVLALLKQMLAYDDANRPTVESLGPRLEDLAEGGQSVRRWAKERAWPADEQVDGELAGRVMSEHSVPIRSGTLEKTHEAAPDQGVGTMVAVALTSALTALLALVLGAWLLSG